MYESTTSQVRKEKVKKICLMEPEEIEETVAYRLGIVRSAQGGKLHPRPERMTKFMFSLFRCGYLDEEMAKNEIKQRRKSRH